MEASTGDLATWVGVVVAFVFSLLAFVVSLVSLKYQRASAKATQRAVAEAQRSADAAEESAAGSTRSADAAERSALAAEQVAEIEAMRDMQPTIAWEVTRESQFAAYLRNAGTETVTGVTVDATVPGVDQAPDGVTLEPGASAKVMISSSLVHDTPREIRVTWDGAPSPVAVPVPPW
ncbi:hypothetical protein Ppa06_64400 [Planomonospora parontospora subsp. parontospora]|uniref:Uncharacterized protein n=2 Tax=Planomonospora parontospora TaxID=58119 RepID=A0AA37F7Z7_9ACTN|nr:hypothetical protein [Planomonospora parontospora]GGK94131.1 hypothetical protein GCM10010126_61860 [Planomonospora parontospora]GII12642.1 hypothetical protein Ppa06_64400 [Planomonospora parontospora subsp. parontospora]